MEPFKLVKNEHNYWEFIRRLRNHPDNINGFISHSFITKKDQMGYMKKHNDCYYVCLKNDLPVGYVGVVDNDIRVCTDPDYKQGGAGSFMINEIMKIFPNATARILKDNNPSLYLFKKCNFQIISEDNEFYYLSYAIKET